MSLRTKLESVRRGLEAAARVLRVAGQLALASMVVTICYDVVLRYVIKSPTTWSLEVNTFLVLFVTLLPAGDVLAADAHLRITFFTDRAPVAVRLALARLTCLLGCAFGALMTWKGFDMVLSAYRYDERMSTPLGTPMFIPYSWVPIGFGIMALYYLVSLFQVRDPKASAPPQEL